ncbi:hypothetical protein BVI434_280017 [Burkholderia vietnamiensis]|nr:hypothetical protein BVI434_280017 [Burkholderia vietnamiensis]
MNPDPLQMDSRISCADLDDFYIGAYVTEE